MSDTENKTIPTPEVVTENQVVENEIDLNTITQLPGIITGVRSDMESFKTEMKTFMSEIRDELKNGRRLKIVNTNSPIQKLTKKEQLEKELNGIINIIK